MAPPPLPLLLLLHAADAASRIQHACHVLPGQQAALTAPGGSSRRRPQPGLSPLCPACLPPPPPPQQVTINLRECVVEDFDSASQPSQRRSTQKLDTKGGGSVSLLIRVSHKVGGRWVYGGGCGWLASWLAARPPLLCCHP